MDIKTALEIIIEGKNKHFDENVVNAFLNIKTYDILKVMVDNLEDIIDISEKNLLKQFNLGELYVILNNEGDAIVNHKKLTDTFNKYYKYNL